MKEKDIQTLFGRQNTVVGAFELKIVKGKSMPFSAVQDHQVKALWNTASEKGMHHKISDASYGQKPYDCFFLKNVPAYVVPVWYVPRVRKTAYYIRIETFVQLQSSAGRQSLTEAMAQVAAEHTITL